MRGIYKAQLSEDEAEAFLRPVVGQGGFQSLLRNLQRNYDRKSRTVTLTDEQVEKINRYSKDYGQGGFEDRLEGIRRNLPRLFE